MVGIQQSDGEEGVEWTSSVLDNLEVGWIQLSHDLRYTARPGSVMSPGVSRGGDTGRRYVKRGEGNAVFDR